MDDFNGPPIRVNRGFLEAKENLFKLAEIFMGIACIIFNTYCFPNNVWLMCSYRIHTFSQIFSIICVNVFFVIITAILAFCSLFGITDAYYKYNFPMLEKFLTGLASLMYGIALIIVLIATLSSSFIASWLLPLFFTLGLFSLYTYDTYTRWKSDNRR